MTRDHLLGWTHAAQFIADSMPASVRPCPVRLVPVTECVGVADVDPAPKASKPAALKCYCDTCQDTGRCMRMVCYGGAPQEEDGDCPDCDARSNPNREDYEAPAAAPAAVLGDGWIDCAPDMPDLMEGRYELRNVSTAYRFTPIVSLLNAVVMAFRNKRYQYRPLPQEAA